VGSRAVLDAVVKRKIPSPRWRGAILPLTQYAFMVWYSVKAQGQLYLHSTCYEGTNYVLYYIIKSPRFLRHKVI
jgi:hypothetical protein